MGMIINSNIPSLNAKNVLKKNSKKTDSAMQKLASGFKINKAADDASGLSITKKMQAQLTALETVNENNGDSVNLVQTTEGYMSEIQEMTARMTELASKSANGVLAQEDRDALQDEMDQLCAEIDRMASTASFNGMKLLSGNKETLSPEYSKYGFTITNNDLFINGKTGAETVNILDNKIQNYHNGDLANLEGKKIYYTESGLVEISDTLPDNIINSGEHYNSVSIFLHRDVIIDYLNLQIGDSSTNSDRLELSLHDFHTDSLLSPSYDSKKTGQTTITSTPTFSAQGNQNSSSTSQTSGGTTTVDTYTSVLSGAFKPNTDVSTYQNAISFNISEPDYAISNLDNIRALSIKVSSIRSEYGAIQNRLDHTINNFGTTHSNLAEANSRILDTNMATGALELSQHNVVNQAAQAMLAQANAKPQQVLDLLR